MPKITINGTEIEVEEGKTVLEAALENDIYIPHFCYHPQLPISGNCRMCLVDVKPGPPKLSIACATVCQDGMEIDTENEKVAAARQGLMEFFLKNHPVDCPVCDQAGECRLHEYYMEYDLEPARVIPEDKVAKRKALRVGKTLMLDADRCVLCTRCVRFMRDVQKDECLVIVNRRDHAEITFFPGREVDNPYSLCLADICPVGAWTSADFRFRQRVWFLESSPSVCGGCARGCNIWIDHRRGEVFRFKPRDNDEVNKCWLCDEGRLSYHAINDDRLTMAQIKTDAGFEAAAMDEAVDRAAGIIREAGQKLAVVVSASMSLEEGRAVLALFQDKLKAKIYIHKGEEGWSDEFLRCADMNANTGGLEGLGIKDSDLGAIAEDAVVVLLETLCPNPLPEGAPGPAIVISPQASAATEKATISIPAASYAESAGTVVNVDGIEQSYEPALPKKGDALTHIEIIERLARVIGSKLVA
jgi:NADH-quinone oxidoreductase subunit G